MEKTTGGDAGLFVEKNAPEDQLDAPAVPLIGTGYYKDYRVASI
jgi:hypothetical protein